MHILLSQYALYDTSNRVTGMCVSPNLLHDGTLVACRKCWQCKSNKINDWVGRNIAEGETAKAAHSITLTYGRDMRMGGVDHERAAVLTYSDVQKYFKRLRKNGYPCRFFAVGEYGSLKGRAHWHCMVYWQDKVPAHELSDRSPHLSEEEKEKRTKRFNEPHWPHGFSVWEKPSPASIMYVCKYLQKDMGADERQAYLAMSKRPPLGNRYFYELARRYVVQGLSPQNPFYWFGHVRDRNDRPVKFRMSRHTLDAFCRSFIDLWRATHGGHYPYSEMLYDYEDRTANYVPELRIEPFQPRTMRPWIDPPFGGSVKFSEPANSYYCDKGGERLWWSFDSEGKRAWQNVIRTESEAERLRLQAELRTASAAALWREKHGRPIGP